MESTKHPPAGHEIEREEVMALLDGELDAPRARALEAHLATCAECRSLAEELKSVSARMSAWKIETSPASLEEKTMSAAEQALTPDPASTARPKLRPRGWRLMLQLALGTAVVVIVAVATIPGFLWAPALIRKQGMVGPAQGSAEQSAPSVVQFEKVAPDAPPAPRTMAESTHGRLDEAKAIRLGPMVIRTASLTLVTKEFERSRAAIQQIVAKHGGFLGQLSVSGESNTGRTLQATLRIPADKLDAAFGELKALGRVTSEAQSGEEVTQQYVDLTARLSNARATEKRLVEVLAQRTGKVKDVLEVEREIARVREEIESMDAQRRAMEKQVQFATVNLRISEEFQKQLEVTPPSTGTTMWNALVEGFRTASDSLLGIAEFALRAGPSLVLWALILCWPARLVWRRFRPAAN
jgi:hypothetical protein